MKYRDIVSTAESARRGRRVRAERSQLQTKGVKPAALTRDQIVDVRAAIEEDLELDRVRQRAYRS